MTPREELLEALTAERFTHHIRKPKPDPLTPGQRRRRLGALLDRDTSADKNAGHSPEPNLPDDTEPAKEAV